MDAATVLSAVQHTGNSTAQRMPITANTYQSMDITVNK